jgi:isoleucyl-tRNA synthetase
MNKIGFLRRSSFFISPKENRFYSSPKDYNHTVLLPKTRFPLRVDATTREPEVMARGGTSLLYDWQLKHNRGSLWVTHDGPPYANGSLHIGHALNKILKDIVNRYAILQGRRVHFVPGFDCHGLPIEMKAMQQQQQSKAKKSSAASTSSSSSSSTSPSTSTSDDSGEKNGSGGSSADARALQIRQQAARFALDNVVGQSNDFMRWGVLGDWKRPYLTLHPQYEAMQIRVFYSMLRNGYIYRGAKPVYWSPSSRTALAEAELEYRDDHVSTSAYVALDVTNRGAALAAALAGKSAPVRLVVWTTTPWTLPANEAVCVSGSIEYAVVEGIDANALLLLAASRLEAFCAALQVQPSNGLRVVATLRGDQLLDVRYRHPTRSAATSTSKRARECAVFAAPHVADDSGSGLVHTAPGHGFEDFVICSQHGIAPYW